jgi:centromere-localized protein 2
MTTPTPPSESQILHSYLLHPSPLPTILPYHSFLALLPKNATSLQTTHATELKRLYRDLQFQRAVIVDDVRRRIESECTRSVSLTAQLARQVRREEHLKQQHKHKQQRNQNRKRKREPEDDREREQDDTSSSSSSDNDDDDETNTTPHLDIQADIQTDTALHGGIPLSNTPAQPTTSLYHNGTSLLRAMETATGDLTAEIADVEAEIAALRAACEGTVGALSDLRYGRFARPSGSGSWGGGVSNAVEDDVLAALADFKERLAAGKGRDETSS